MIKWGNCPLYRIENVRSIRPGYGLAPKHYDHVIGKKALVDIPSGTALSFDLIQSNAEE